MFTEIFLIHLFRESGPRGLIFWITAAVYVIMIACAAAGKWMMFQRTGRTPWHSLIPFWNEYDLYDLCWDGRFGLAAGVLYILIFLIYPGSGATAEQFRYWPFLLILFLLAMGISGIMKVKLSKSFGHSRAFTYGLLFLQSAFYLILGLSKSAYFGRTLRKYNAVRVKENKAAGKEKKSRRQYMISLHRSRSVIALIASVLTFGLCLFAVAGGLIEDPSEVTPERGSQLFKLFTVCSNFFSAIGAAMMIPYAVEGVRNKRFSYPKWVQLLQYSGAVCTTLTMIFAFCLIWPVLGSAIAFGGMNFWLHVVCPIMSLILLFSVEADLELTVNDALICLGPFYLYAAVYITNVVLIGEANGGWRDIYRLISIIPATLSAPLMYLLGFAIALAIRQIYNRISHARQKEMRMLWSDDLTPVEVKIEVLGLGRHSGIHDDITNITVPFDIFRGLSEKYGLTVTELSAAYNRGVLGGLEERDEYLEERREFYDTLFGTPEKLQKKTGE